MEIRSMETLKYFASGSLAKKVKDSDLAVLKAFNLKSYPARRYGVSPKKVVLNSVLTKSQSR